MATTTVPESTSVGTGPPKAKSQGIQWSQLWVGVFFMAGAALGFVLWHGSSTARVPVLTLTGDVSRGHVLTADDLRVAHIGTDDPVATIPAEQAGDLVGRAAMTDLRAGTFVVAEQFAAGSTLTPGSGVVGLALGPGQYPTPQLRVGDLVNVVVASEDDPDGRLLVEAAEVVWVEPVGTQGQRFVSLLTGEPTAGQVAATAANGEVRLVLVARDGQDDR